MNQLTTTDFLQGFRKYLMDTMDWQIDEQDAEAFTKSMILGAGEVLGKNKSTESKFRFKIGEVTFGVSYNSGAEGNFGIEIMVGNIDDAVDFTETNLIKRITKNMEKSYGTEPAGESALATLTQKFFEYMCRFGRENEDTVVDIENYITLMSNNEGQIKFIAGSEMKQKIKSDIDAEAAEM